MNVLKAEIFVKERDLKSIKECMNQKNKIKLLGEEQAQLRISILRAEEGITKT